MNTQLFESNGEFAKEYIDAAVTAIRDCNSKEALQCLEWAAEKLAAMRTNLGHVGR